MAGIPGLRRGVSPAGGRYSALPPVSGQASRPGCALRAAELEIQRETKRLEELEAEAEKRREAMVEAKKETSSIEKLKEKKLEAYHKEEAKSEELFIEEFISSTRAHAAS